MERRKFIRNSILTSLALGIDPIRLIGMTQSEMLAMNLNYANELDGENTQKFLTDLYNGFVTSKYTNSDYVSQNKYSIRAGGDLMLMTAGREDVMQNYYDNMSGYLAPLELGVQLTSEQMNAHALDKVPYNQSAYERGLQLDMMVNNLGDVNEIVGYYLMMLPNATGEAVLKISEVTHKIVGIASEAELKKLDKRIFKTAEERRFLLDALRFNNKIKQKLNLDHDTHDFQIKDNVKPEDLKQLEESQEMTEEEKKILRGLASVEPSEDDEPVSEEELLGEIMNLLNTEGEEQLNNSLNEVKERKTAEQQYSEKVSNQIFYDGLRGAAGVLINKLDITPKEKVILNWAVNTGITVSTIGMAAIGPIGWVGIGLSLFSALESSGPSEVQQMGEMVMKAIENLQRQIQEIDRKLNQLSLDVRKSIKLLNEVLNEIQISRTILSNQISVLSEEFNRYSKTSYSDKRSEKHLEYFKTPLAKLDDLAITKRNKFLTSPGAKLNITDNSQVIENLDVLHDQFILSITNLRIYNGSDPFGTPKGKDLYLATYDPYSIGGALDDEANATESFALMVTNGNTEGLYSSCGLLPKFYAISGVDLGQLKINEIPNLQQFRIGVKHYAQNIITFFDELDYDSSKRKLQDLRTIVQELSRSLSTIASCYVVEKLNEMHHAFLKTKAKELIKNVRISLNNQFKRIEELSESDLYPGAITRVPIDLKMGKSIGGHGVPIVYTIPKESVKQVALYFEESKQYSIKINEEYSESSFGGKSPLSICQKLEILEIVEQNTSSGKFAEAASKYTIYRVSKPVNKNTLTGYHLFEGMTFTIIEVKWDFDNWQKKDQNARVITIVDRDYIQGNKSLNPGEFSEQQYQSMNNSLFRERLDEILLNNEEESRAFHFQFVNFMEFLNMLIRGHMEGVKRNMLKSIANSIDYKNAEMDEFNKLGTALMSLSKLNQVIRSKEGITYTIDYDSELYTSFDLKKYLLQFADEKLTSSSNTKECKKIIKKEEKLWTGEVEIIEETIIENFLEQFERSIYERIDYTYEITKAKNGTIEEQDCEPNLYLSLSAIETALKMYE